MQFELRTNTIEPVRKTFDNLIARYGDRPASRYEEGTIDLQARENYHYRPTWAPDREIYDPEFSVLKLEDPYTFTDPRQYYYAPYVTKRAQDFESFATTLDYVSARDLLTRLPAGWAQLLTEIIIALRHYESGAQMISCEAARFGWGTTITQCAAYAAFDRVGNAQLLARMGIAAGGGGTEVLDQAKQAWMDAAHLQPLRRRIEELMVERDWGAALVGLDICDQLLYRLCYSALDDAALTAGAGAYSLLAQHFWSWFADQRKWLDRLSACWLADPVHGAANAAKLRELTTTALAQARAAVVPLADVITEWTGVDTTAAVDEAVAQVTNIWGASS